jgi:hypothetical protein
MKIKTWVATIFTLIAVLLALPAFAQNLPPGLVTMTADIHEYESCASLPSFSSYFDANLSGVPSGYSLANGKYNGWCSDLTGDLRDNPLFGDVIYQVRFYSSLDPSLPDNLINVTGIGEYTIPWDKINYLLNAYPNASWLDMEPAIWSLVHNGCGNAQDQSNGFICPPERNNYFPYGRSSAGTYGCPGSDLVNMVNVAAYVLDANSNGANFVPGPGQLVAAVGELVSCNDLSSCPGPRQVIFIPVLIPCDLELEKTCEVPQLPGGQFVCSNAKPINSLTMIWKGTQTISIKAWKGSVGSILLDTINDIQPGEEVTVSGYAGSPNDVYWEIFKGTTTTGAKIGVSTFHVSCSDIDMNGPEDCGKPAGDGKGMCGGGMINTWKFEGMAGNDQVLNCTPDVITPTNECSLAPVPPPDCINAGQPKSLTFRYTGGGCAESNNTQAPYKAFCTATPVGGLVTGNITVKAAGSSSFTYDVYNVSPSDVAPANEFTITFGSSYLKADSYVKITGEDEGGNPVTELNKIHTSCSQPLKVGDVFGSLELVALNGQTAGNDVKYTYTLKNVGNSTITGIKLTDDKLGLIADSISLAADQSYSIDAVTELQDTTTNIATAEVVGRICKATASATVTVELPQTSFVCSDAKPLDTISLIWHGSQNITVKAWKGAIGGSTLLKIIPLVKPGDMVTVDGYYGSPNDVYWEIFRAGTYEKIGTSTFHLSCSDPDMNGPEDCGKYEGNGKGMCGFINDWLFAGMDSLVCGQVTPPPPPKIQVTGKSTGPWLGDHWLRWDLTNSGTDAAVINKVEVFAWPEKQGKLKMIKLDGDVSADPPDIAWVSPGTAVITVFTADAIKKRIDAGKTRAFIIEFEKYYLYDTKLNYSFVITFEGGATLKWNH